VTRLPLDLVEMQLVQGKTPDFKGKLAAVQQGVNRLNQELELLAAKSSQQQRSRPQNLDLAALAREQLDFWRADMFFKHETVLDLQLRCGAALCRAVYLDAALAFNALAANALEAMQAAQTHELAIRCFSEGDRVGLAVSDSGPGPDPDMASRMFEPFTTDKGPEHDGLGLFLAREALAPWGGRIIWDGDREAGFRLTLPRSQAQADHP
jgi:C4-dicarboxylate-specific signal transduction histidine kinase